VLAQDHQDEDQEATRGGIVIMIVHQGEEVEEEVEIERRRNLISVWECSD